MKLKIIIVISVIFLLVLFFFAVKKYFDNSVVDKHGMVRDNEKTTVICGDVITK